MNVVSAAVALAFGVFLVIAAVASGSPESQRQYVQVAFIWALVTTPWVIATRLLWRAWWARARELQPTADGPARLVAAAVAALPHDRRDWGTAMIAELAHVQGRGARWSFATGCTRVAVFPPGGSRVTVLEVGVVSAAAAVATELVIGRALPAMRIFAATFVALAGAWATLEAARSRRLRRPASGPAVVIAGVGGVAACIASTASMLVEHPSAADALGPVVAVVFAVAIAGCLGLVLAPPRMLASSRFARRLSVASAVALGACLVPASRLALRGDQGVEAGVAPYLFLAPVVVLFAAAAIAAAVGRSFRAGVQAAVWTALLGTLAIFVVGVPEALHWYRIEARLFFDGEQGYDVGRNLDGFIWGLVLLPIWWLPFGIMGAAAGVARHGRLWSALDRLGVGLGRRGLGHGRLGEGHRRAGDPDRVGRTDATSVRRGAPAEMLPRRFPNDLPAST